MSDNELLTKIYEELLTYKNRKAWLKTGQTPLTGTSLKKKINEWQSRVWKAVPHHIAYGNAS